MKKCLGCHENKPLTEYHFKRGKPQSRCKACRALYMNGLYMANREREKAKRKQWYEENKVHVSKRGKMLRAQNPEKYTLGRRLTKYGITKEHYLQTLMTQRNSCGICEDVFTETPSFDHCHKTGTFRGLLCDNCNTGLGLLDESIPVIQRAIAYIQKYQN